MVLHSGKNEDSPLFSYSILQLSTIWIKKTKQIQLES